MILRLRYHSLEVFSATKHPNSNRRTLQIVVQHWHELFHFLVGLGSGGFIGGKDGIVQLEAGVFRFRREVLHWNDFGPERLLIRIRFARKKGK